jgi:rod shape-determining protein MreD
VPALLIGLVMLFADLMMSRPPGLFAAIALVAVEMLKARASQLRNTPFSVEWITASMAIAAVIIGYRLILMLLLVESFALSTALVQILFTILIYPVVIGVSWVFFGLRKPTLGEVNALGQRL